MKNTPLLKKTRAESGPSSARVRFVRRIGGLTFIAGLLVGSTTPAAAHFPEPLDYVAFGDSYTSGIGAPNVTVSPPYPAAPEPCFQAQPGYPDVLDKRADVDLTENVACSGWTAAMVPIQVKVAAEAGLLDARTDLVTITAGGNDVGFLELLATCRTQPLDVCKTAVRTAEGFAKTEVRKSLVDAYAAIRTKAPNATIIALGYPHLFSPEFRDEPFLADEAARVFNDGTDTLNRVIRDAARQIRGTVYVDVTDEFDGHGIGSPHPWIIFNPSDNASFHPTEIGYEKGYARAIVREAGIRALVR